MSELTPYELSQLTNQSECYIHTHPRVDNFTFPHGGFSDTTTQTHVGVFTPTAMLVNTVDVSDGVKVVDSSKFYVPRDGIYNLQFSVQVTNTDTASYEMSVWFRINGVDVPNSASQVTIPSKHGSDNGHAIPSWNIFLRMDKGDYAEVIWCSAGATVYLEAIPAITSPVTRPAVPSVIITVSFISDR